MKKADGWTWEEFSLEGLSREDLKAALVDFVKAAERGYRTRTLADEVWWWDNVAEEVLKSPEGVVRLDGGIVTRRCKQLGHSAHFFTQALGCLRILLPHPSVPHAMKSPEALYSPTGGPR